MKRLLVVMMAITEIVAFATTPTITGVTAQQRYPWNGKVDISYTVTGDIAEEAKQRALLTSLKVSAIDMLANTTNIATQLSGDVSLEEGTHAIVWDMDAEGFPLPFNSSNMEFSVSCEITPALYCVIDLSGGANASSYSVTYLAEPPSGGFNVEVYKTTRLALRRIEAGTFKMGGQYNVTLTQPFFCGIFEVTQRQYELVTGTNPSLHIGHARPVEYVSYDMIRGSSAGALWPSSSAVDTSSFMGKLRARTGLDFDLPTEAQWEYACRAGTESDYDNGGNSENDLRQIGRYSGNTSDCKGGYSSYHTTVGSYLPNAWGLYDMHGNDWEWCLDWNGELLNNAVNPSGNCTGTGRIARGGCWGSSPFECVSSYRHPNRPSVRNGGQGFRLARTLFLVVGDTPTEPTITPVSGTFGASLSVSISCPTDGATIHYTTDGSEPTIESPVYRRFRIYGKTTVKAIAEKDGMLSEVVTAEYALGRCVDPVISLADGTEFTHSNQEVSIRWNNDGVLRYTLDGSEPTAASPIYEGPFTVNDSVVVKAKVFSGDFFDSAVVTASLTRVWENVATPVIEAVSPFTGSKTKVVISCATDGAVVRYTLNGNEPNSHSTKYTGPFYVTDSCTVKAYAVMSDYLNSAVATHVIEKVWTIGDALGKPDHGFSTDGTEGVGWMRVTDATAPNGEAMKSGAITHSQQSVLSTKVMGPGTLTFSWRTSCEKDPDDIFEWDHVEFAVDGAIIRRIDGITAWQNESVRIDGDGEHTVTWTYVKDDVESEGDDAAYVAGYGWVSDYTETKTTAVPVPYAWLLQNDPEIVDEFDAYEAAALATAMNGYNKVWECYVAGISPTNEMASFTVKIEMKDGWPVVTWEPDLNTNGVVRTYKVYGSETLDNGGEWQYPTNSLHRFFKVVVELP